MPTRSFITQRLLSRHWLGSTITTLIRRLGISVEKYALTDVHLELTNICNLKCAMCPTNRGMQREKCCISFELVKKIVEENPQTQSYGLNDWGEPLLHPQFLKIVEFLKGKGKRVYFATNATLMNEGIAEALVHMKVDSIIFSIDGAYEDYEKIRGSDYEKVKANALNLLKVAKERGVSMRTCIVATVGRENEEAIERLRADWNGIMPVTTQPRLLFRKDERKGLCSQLFRNHVIVLSNGKVVPCCADYEGYLEVGDAWKQTLNEIINGEKMKKLRADSSGTFCDFCSEYKSKEAVDRFKTNPIFRKVKMMVGNVWKCELELHKVV